MHAAAVEEPLAEREVVVEQKKMLEGVHFSEDCGFPMPAVPSGTKKKASYTRCHYFKSFTSQPVTRLPTTFVSVSTKRLDSL